jgi:hypothetical protein
MTHKKPFKKDDKKAAIKLWKALVPLSKIRVQLKVSESTLHCLKSTPKLYDATEFFLLM